MTDLIKQDSGVVSLAPDAQTMKAAALEASALVCRVNDAESQQKAVEAQAALLKVIRAVEQSREVAKKPVLELGRQIDQAARDFIAELDAEGNRVAALVNEFQETERIKLQAESRLQDSALSRLERERDEKLACAETMEEQDAIREEYSQKIHLTTTPLKATPIAKGQLAKPDFEITVTDIHALYHSNPNCVDMKPKLSVIKSLVASGFVPRGVTAKPVIRSTVRTATKPSHETKIIGDKGKP